MKPIKSQFYTIPNSSTFLKVVKIKYAGSNYCVAKIEFYLKSGILINTMNNAKLYYDKINHWEHIKWKY